MKALKFPKILYLYSIFKYLFIKINDLLNFQFHISNLDWTKDICIKSLSNFYFIKLSIFKLQLCHFFQLFIIKIYIEYYLDLSNPILK